MEKYIISYVIVLQVTLDQIIKYYVLDVRLNIPKIVIGKESMPEAEPLTIRDRVTFRNGKNVGVIEDIDLFNRRVLVYWGKDRELEARIWEPMHSLVRFTEKCLSPEEVDKRQAPDRLTTVIEN